MNDEQEARSRFQVYPKRLCRIVLVHGTWPAGFWTRPPPPPKHPPSTVRAMSKRRWYERESSFRIWMTTEFMLHELAYVFYPFVWSGRNSVYARDEAAKSVAKLLTDAFEAFPKDDFVIIAHSHGGNTALRALHYLGDQAKRVFLITMGTPFLQIHASTRMTRRLSVNSTILGFSLALFLAGWLLQYETIARPLSAWWGSIGLMLVCWLLSEGLVFFLFNRDYFGSRWCKRPTNIARAAFYDLRETPPARLLVLRAFDDEASLSLAAGALATRITNSLAVKILPGCLVLVGLGSVVLLALATLFPSVNKMLWPLVTLHITTLPKVSMWFGLFAFTISVVPGPFKAVFGRELLLGAARCEISAESVPDISDGIDIITLKPHRFTDTIRRRHAVYDNEACHAAISEWIRRVVKPPISMLPYIAVDGQDWIAAHRRFFPPTEERAPSTEVPKQNS